MEISSKVVDSFFDVFLSKSWILSIFSFRSEGLDGISEVEVGSSGIDSVVDDLDVSLRSLIWTDELTLFTSRPFLIHLIQLLIICQLALAFDSGLCEGVARPFRGVIPLIDIEWAASRPSFIHR